MCFISHLKPISRCGMSYLKVSVYLISKAIVNVEFLFFLKNFCSKLCDISKKPFSNLQNLCLLPLFSGLPSYPSILNLLHLAH